MKKEEKNFLLRLRAVFAVVAAVGFVLIANLFYIQISNGNQFRAQADGQYVVATHNSFERGSIFFEQRDGTRISAAGQRSGYKISINPSTYTGDAQKLFSDINSIIEIDEERFFNAIERTERTYVEIANKVPQDEGHAIKERVGSQVQLHAEKWRVYPLKGSGAHVLGFLGFKGDEYAGRYGLERVFEDVLKREDVDLYTNFFARVFHNVKNIVDTDAVPEGNIVTTIDPQIQLYFENQLKGIQTTWSSESVGGIIIHPQTGEIYAMGAFPNFDNNDFSDAPTSSFRNPIVENVYEVGSIVKPLVVATALDSGVLDVENFEYYDDGSVVVEDFTIKNFDGRGRGWVSVQDILDQSLNTGMVEIGSLIDRDDFRSYIDGFGLSEKTGIDLPNEGMNLLSNLQSPRDIEFANISFGQGIAVTPISITRAISALANNGVPTNPHIVKKIEYTNGFSKVIDLEGIGNQVISRETSGEITRMLVNAFDSYRSGAVKLPNYSIAAKTGTAQIPNPEGGYYDDRNLHSFFGYFPAYDPEFLVFLYTVHPKEVKYSSQTLIDPFRGIAKYLINYYDVAPDR